MFRSSNSLDIQSRMIAKEMLSLNEGRASITLAQLVGAAAFMAASLQDPGLKESAIETFGGAFDAYLSLFQDAKK